MGTFPLILGRVRLMGLNSHLHPNNYVPMYNLVPLSLPRVDVRTRAHHLYTLRILWCISSTIHFTLITITNTLCTCATLHIALWLSLLGFPLVDENLHDNTGPKGKLLSLARVESSLLNEEARRKDWKHGTDWNALVTKTDTNRGRGQNRSRRTGNEV